VKRFGPSYRKMNFANLLFGALLVIIVFSLHCDGQENQNVNAPRLEQGPRRGGRGRQGGGGRRGQGGMRGPGGRRPASSAALPGPFLAENIPGVNGARPTGFGSGGMPVEIESVLQSLVQNPRAILRVVEMLITSLEQCQVANNQGVFQPTAATPEPPTPVVDNRCDLCSDCRRCPECPRCQPRPSPTPIVEPNPCQYCPNCPAWCHGPPPTPVVDHPCDVCPDCPGCNPPPGPPPQPPILVVEDPCGLAGDPSIPCFEHQCTSFFEQYSRNVCSDPPITDVSGIFEPYVYNNASKLCEVPSTGATNELGYKICNCCIRRCDVQLQMMYVAGHFHSHPTCRNVNRRTNIKQT